MPQSRKGRSRPSSRGPRPLPLPPQRQPVPQVQGTAPDRTFLQMLGTIIDLNAQVSALLQENATLSAENEYMRGRLTELGESVEEEATE
jgi:hypothetical protein